MQGLLWSKWEQSNQFIDWQDISTKRVLDCFPMVFDPIQAPVFMCAKYQEELRKTWTCTLFFNHLITSYPWSVNKDPAFFVLYFFYSPLWCNSPQQQHIMLPACSYLEVGRSTLCAWSTIIWTIITFSSLVLDHHNWFIINALLVDMVPKSMWFPFETTLTSQNRGVSIGERNSVRMQHCQQHNNSVNSWQRFSEATWKIIVRVSRAEEYLDTATSSAMQIHTNH